MRKLLGVGLATAVLVTGCTEKEAGRAAHTVNIDALEVTDTTPVDAQGVLRLSPNGERVLATISGGICATRIDGSDEKCVDDDVSIDEARATWSPDGTQVAFTDDFWRAAYEPDLWVFDVASGEARNLTDDGTEDNVLQDESDDALIDLLPSWSSDGETIRFARGTSDADADATLMEIPATGGEPTELRSIDANIRMITALAWSPDGETVAWTAGVSDGVVHLGESTADDDTVVMPEQEGLDNMSLSFSPAGDELLIDSLVPYGAYSATEFNSARVVSVGEEGEPAKIADVKSVGFPTWAPSGRGIAFVGADGLYVVPEPGGEPRRLVEGREFAAPDATRLNWATGKLLVYREGEPTLLELSG